MHFLSAGCNDYKLCHRPALNWWLAQGATPPSPQDCWDCSKMDRWVGGCKKRAKCDVLWISVQDDYCYHEKLRHCSVGFKIKNKNSEKCPDYNSLQLHLLLLQQPWDGIVNKEGFASGQLKYNSTVNNSDTLTILLKHKQVLKSALCDKCNPAFVTMSKCEY